MRLLGFWCMHSKAQIWYKQYPILCVSLQWNVALEKGKLPSETETTYAGFKMCLASGSFKITLQGFQHVLFYYTRENSREIA